MPTLPGLTSFRGDPAGEAARVRSLGVAGALGPVLEGFEPTINFTRMPAW